MTPDTTDNFSTSYSQGAAVQPEAVTTPQSFADHLDAITYYAEARAQFHPQRWRHVRACLYAARLNYAALLEGEQ